MTQLRLQFLPAILPAAFLTLLFCPGTAAAPLKGVCSASPINPASPPAETPLFKAGDKIYCMFRVEKTWREALDKGAPGLLTYFYVDGAEKIYRYIGFKRADLFDQNYFLLDIAPDPAQMSNYKDRDVVFPEKDGVRFGPEMFTQFLGQLPPGRHTIRVAVQSFGQTRAEAEFQVDGSNYSAYAALHQNIKGAASSMQTMPRPGMTDKALEAQMTKLAANAGFGNVIRLFIVDKDWWMDRASGGNSAFVSRHIAAAVAVNQGGSCAYSVETFFQPRLITGGWGRLELRGRAQKKPIPCANVNR